ncbi:MAG: MotA/TolQ/ExbB proton channel family protein [Verrucomicrobium sp.]|nr:MotA/TolQ/ExbB proton channel family protein [Verrucomicrobium sp.]
MLLLIGWAIVFGSVLGGFMYNGGHIESLLHPGEWIIIVGVMIGFLVGSSPGSVLKLMIAKIKQAVGAPPYTQQRYMDLCKALYELFMVAREQGVVGIEEHVINPSTSSVFSKYPSFLNDHHAVSFLQDALRPLIEGRMKPEQLRASLNEDLERLSIHSEAPIMILTKVADALPGVGIVAAVLGIVVTMGFIAGEKAKIGEKVAAALVGTFLGLLISYGLFQPMILKLEFINEDELAYYQVMCNMIVSYATGSPPVMAAEAGRRTIPADRQPAGDAFETELKALKKA